MRASRSWLITVIVALNSTVIVADNMPNEASAVEKIELLGRNTTMDEKIPGPLNG